MIDNVKPIKDLKYCYYPKRLIFFDTESFIHDPDENLEKHSLRLGACIFVELDDEQKVIFEEIFVFKTSKDFWDYVERKNVNDVLLWVYAHNVKYDLANIELDKPLRSKGYTIPAPIMNHAFVLNAKRDKKKIKILDTFNYVRTSVKEMAKSVNMKKMEVDFFNSTEDELTEYCINDVQIIKEFVLNLIRVLSTKQKNGKKLGSLKNTTASIAFDVYRHSFITHPVYYHHNDEILKIEREAYRGGMVECFHLNHLETMNYYLLDVNSMYPYVMSTFKLPTVPLAHITKNKNIEDLNKYINSHYVIADVLIKVGEKSIRRYGLKFEDKENGKRLIFPIGTYRITLHNEELKECLKNDEILEIYEYVVYRSEPCLKKYADYFYQMKQDATNKADYEIAKLLMNSLYGRLGMRKYINYEISFSGIPGMEDFNSSYFMDTTPDGKNQILYKWGDSFIKSYAVDNEHVKNTNIASAGSVTAYARMVLTRYMEIAGYTNVYYSDTDSLVINEVGYQKLLPYLDPKKLGFMKMEMMFNNGYINAPKDYRFYQKNKLYPISIKQNTNILPFMQNPIILNSRTRTKGIPLHAEMNEQGEYTYWRFTTLKEYMRSNGENYGRLKQVKTKSLAYHKGEKLSNGLVIPYNMRYENEENKII